MKFTYVNKATRILTVVCMCSLPVSTIQAQPPVNNNPPVVVPGQVFAVSESIAVNDPIGTVQATDADTSTTFRNWQITGGNGEDYFRIDANTGVLRRRSINTIDFERTTSYVIRVRVSDGRFNSAVEDVTINLINENDNRPKVTGQQHFHINFWPVFDSPVGYVLATDNDDKNDPGFTTFSNWQIVGGTGAAVFAIDAEGFLSIIQPEKFHDPDRETYSLRIQVSDGQLTSTVVDVDVSMSETVPVCNSGEQLVLPRDQVGALLAADPNVTPGICIIMQGTKPRTNTNTMQQRGNNSNNISINVYPNPVKERITVSLGKNDLHIRKIAILDLSGRLIMQVAVNTDSGIVTIPRGKLIRGIYILSMQGDKVITKKIIVD